MKSIRQKRIEAQQRAEDRSKRSAAQQLKILDASPGESKRERARLAKFIEVVKTDKLTPQGEHPKPVKVKKAKAAK
jgi:hypothetical protein